MPTRPAPAMAAARCSPLARPAWALASRACRSWTATVALLVGDEEIVGPAGGLRRLEAGDGQRIGRGGALGQRRGRRGWQRRGEVDGAAQAFAGAGDLQVLVRLAAVGGDGDAGQRIGDDAVGRELVGVVDQPVVDDEVGDLPAGDVQALDLGVAHADVDQPHAAEIAVAEIAAVEGRPHGIAAAGPDGVLQRAGHGDRGVADDRAVQAHAGPAPAADGLDLENVAVRCRELVDIRPVVDLERQARIVDRQPFHHRGAAVAAPAEDQRAAARIGDAGSDIGAAAQRAALAVVHAVERVVDEAAALGALRVVGAHRLPGAVDALAMVEAPGVAAVDLVEMVGLDRHAGELLVRQVAPDLRVPYLVDGSAAFEQRRQARMRLRFVRREGRGIAGEQIRHGARVIGVMRHRRRVVGVGASRGGDGERCRLEIGQRTHLRRDGGSGLVLPRGRLEKATPQLFQTIECHGLSKIAPIRLKFY
ncbi:MAG: hypothetical protein WDN72_01440 [Alphaproteobacteria bacterium]